MVAASSTGIGSPGQRGAVTRGTACQPFRVLPSNRLISSPNMPRLPAGGRTLARTGRGRFPGGRLRALADDEPAAKQIGLGRRQHAASLDQRHQPRHRPLREVVHVVVDRRNRRHRVAGGLIVVEADDRERPGHRHPVQLGPAQRAEREHVAAGEDGGRPVGSGHDAVHRFEAAADRVVGAGADMPGQRLEPGRGAAHRHSRNTSGWCRTAASPARRSGGGPRRSGAAWRRRRRRTRRCPRRRSRSPRCRPAAPPGSCWPAAAAGARAAHAAPDRSAAHRPCARETCSIARISASRLPLDEAKSTP